MTLKTKNKYHISIIFLHWIMALSIFLMLISGVTMEYVDFDKAAKINFYKFHKSLGILLLITIFIRIFCRILTKTPPSPDKLSNVEKKLAKFGHYLLYLLIVLMTLSGWLIVSTSSSGIPTIVFGLFEWPHLPNLAGNKQLHILSELIHLIIAIILFITIVGHIISVIKYKIINKENLLKRIS